MKSDLPSQNSNDRSNLSLWQFLVTMPIQLQRQSLVFIVVNFLDIFMTWRLLMIASQGGARYYESNPLAKFIIDHWGINGMIYFKFGMVGFIILLTQVIATKKLELAKWVLNLGTGIVVFVVFYSLWLLVRF